MAHVNTLFSQVLQFIPRHEFQKAVVRHFGDKGVRTLTCWGQFATLLFGQITGHSSIRSMITAINTQEHFLYHLGMKPIKRSTLSDANERRDPRILEAVFYNLLSRTQGYAPGHHFRFKGKILAMDSSTINLCLNLCPWAQFHHGKGAFKLHTAIDLAGDLPTFMVMSAGKVHDIIVARRRTFEHGTTLLMDRGYIDFAWLYQLTEKGIHFVTRMKDNCQFKVRQCFERDRKKGIGADQEIKLTGVAGKKYSVTLRRISYCDPETGDRYVFITNRFDLSAKTICDLYKARWRVELFFKTLKGQLQINKFVGTSENAVMWQVWTAMIAYLLICLIRFMNKVSWSVPCTMAALAIALFQKIDFKRLFGLLPRDRCVNITLQRQLLLPI